MKFASELQTELVHMVQGTMFTADGGQSIRKLLEPVQEPFRPEMNYYETARERGVYEMWQIQIRRTELCKAYLERWNQSEGLDAILCKSNILLRRPADEFRSYDSIRDRETR